VLSAGAVASLRCAPGWLEAMEVLGNVVEDRGMCRSFSSAICIHLPTVLPAILPPIRRGELALPRRDVLLVLEASCARVG